MEKTDKKTVAVIKTGGKQYFVKVGDEIIVDQLPVKEKSLVDLEKLALFTNDGTELEIGRPTLPTPVKAEVVAHLKGDKIRVAKFKAKVRYRRVRGFRAKLTKVKIVKI